MHRDAFMSTTAHDTSQPGEKETTQTVRYVTGVFSHGVLGLAMYDEASEEVGDKTDRRFLKYCAYVAGSVPRMGRRQRPDGISDVTTGIDAPSARHRFCGHECCPRIR